jgi:transmembrane sensor
MKPWEEENTDFLAKWLNNELDEQSKTEFENSPEGIEFKKLVSASDQLKLPPFDVNAAYELFRPDKKILNDRPKVGISRSVFLYAAAATLLLIAVFTFLLNGENLTAVSTAVGESRRVELPDGSSIMLNANSGLKYGIENWANDRTVILEGEAFFEVKSGNDFVVETDEGNIKVLGTSFNIRARDENLKVVCYTGKVNVSNNDSSNDLTPGHIIVIEKGEIIAQSEDDTATLPSWIRGVSTFENAPFKTVLAELKNHYPLEIDYDGSFDDERLTVTFPNKNLELSVSIVMKALNIRYTFDASNNVLDILGKN